MFDTLCQLIQWTVWAELQRQIVDDYLPRVRRSQAIMLAAARPILERAAKLPESRGTAEQIEAQVREAWAAWP